MSTTDRKRSYSDVAGMCATEAFIRPRCGNAGVRHMRLALDAAHDREALGLDASARLGDILDEVVEWLREAMVDTFCTSLPDDLLREFDAKGTR